MQIIIDKNSNFSHKGGGKDNPRSEHSQSSAPSNVSRADKLGAGHLECAEIIEQLEKEKALLLEACKEAEGLIVKRLVKTSILQGERCESSDIPTADLLKSMRAAINAAQGNSGSGDLNSIKTL